MMVMGGCGSSWRPALGCAQPAPAGEGQQQPLHLSVALQTPACGCACVIAPALVVHMLPWSLSTPLSVVSCFCWVHGDCMELDRRSCEQALHHQVPTAMWSGRPLSPPTCSAKLFLPTPPTPPDTGATLAVRSPPWPAALLPPRLVRPAGVAPRAAAQAGAPKASSSSSSDPVQLL